MTRVLVVALAVLATLAPCKGKAKTKSYGHHARAGHHGR